MPLTLTSELGGANVRLGSVVFGRSHGRCRSSALFPGKERPSRVISSTSSWNPYGEGASTTDASLLIPTTSLDAHYLGATRPIGPDSTHPASRVSSYLTVVATADNTEVTVTPVVDATRDETMDPLPSNIPETITLDAFDVLQDTPGGF